MWLKNGTNLNLMTEKKIMICMYFHFGKTEWRAIVDISSLILLGLTGACVLEYVNGPVTKALSRILLHL